ncbi:phage major capsid protein [Pseudooceanicola lipolyticus]|nr:phage major capsid protein [Pseudooceanicola lipolyticus]
MSFMKQRGIVAVHAQGSQEPVAILRELTQAFGDFRNRSNAQVQELTNNVDDINRRVAALKIGAGGTMSEPESGAREVGSALRSFIRNGDEGPMASLIQAPQAGMSTDSDPDGGYAVYPVLGSNMNRRVHEISPMRQLARIVAVSSDTYEELNDLDEVGAGWVNERESRPDTTTPKFGKLSVPVHEVYAMPKVTQKLLDDAVLDIASWVVEKCAERFARKEGSAFINGDGVSSPRGLLTYSTAAEDDETRDWGVIEHVPTGVSAGWKTPSSSVSPADCLIDVTYTLKAMYRQKASWLMNRKTASVVRKFKDADGAFIWSTSLVEGQPDRLLGFPVVLDEEMPDIDAGSLSIAFGDFHAAYVIVDRHGLRLLRDPFTDKPNVRFYTYKRVGGGLANSEAVKLVRFSSS